MCEHAPDQLDFPQSVSLRNYELSLKVSCPDTNIHTTLLHTAGQTPCLLTASYRRQPVGSKIGVFPTRDRIRGRGWGESSGSRTEGELGLAMLSIYTCRAEHQSLEDVRQGDDALDAGALIHHHQPMHLAANTGNTVTDELQISPEVISKCTCVFAFSKPHFSFDYPVHNGLHRFHFVALHDSFEVLRAMLQSLCHRDVQVVVRLLSRQVLHTNTKK